MNKNGSTVTKGSKPVKLPEKDTSYFKKIAEKIKPFAETETVDGERYLFFRTEHLPEILGTFKIDFKDHLGKLIQHGFLKIKTTDPPGWYFFPEGNPEAKKDREYTTKQLRKIAQRLYKYADRDNTYEQEMRFRYKGLIEMTLNRWGHDPDLVINLLEAKSYLVKRQKSGDPESFFIFRTQKEGQDF